MDRWIEWAKSIECRPRNIYRNSNGNIIGLYEQHKLYDKRIYEYHSRWKRHATDVWTNQWFDKCDPKYRSDVCMDRRFEWPKSIECRPRNLYGDSNRNGVGLYKQHKLYDKSFIKYHSKWKHNATDVRTNQWLHQRDPKHRSDVCMDRWFERPKSIERRPRHLYGNCYGDVIGLYEQHKLCDKRLDEYNSRWKRNATDVWTNQWLHQRDTKHGSDVCMDRWFEWTKSIECRSRHLYGNGDGDGIGLYEQHKFHDKRIYKYHSRWKRNVTYVRTNEWFDQRDSKYRSDVCMDRGFEWTKSIECRSRHLYGNGDGDGIGLYKQYKLYC
jgi:hypothetical protein